ncbi:MAG: ATP-binding protein [Endomicrobium sp.]|jgi:phosphoserine phosphatase|uniref:ATP-binding protein n=1 Tax=Candidatus Endomicrobiellum cubanum TaxID=3242325 RepID=UPI002820EBA7|nr:ATP-binding protein [Endomicrobium sp.]MDR2395203.1 ATP-binding protein [Endomicrobium sp.]
MKKLPLSTQSFSKLIEDNKIYVDKTEHIYNLINSGSVYFLSRPRRFGKSLLISTFKELFKGNKKIFEGLYIYDKWDWIKTNPVIHLDFTEIGYKTSSMLENSLLDYVNSLASKYEVELTNSALPSRFAQLIEKLHEKAGDRVVILVDEYDKPLIDNLSKNEVYPEVKRTLHDFYQVIKASDEHLRFVFLTGVSRFSGLSIFSGLNNLIDITMEEESTGICGYTQKELESNFKEYIQNATKANKMTVKKLLSEIKRWYNGYSWDGKTLVYNPFSTLAFFRKKEFESYWFATGTPTFLIEQIRQRDDLELFIGPKVVDSNSLRGRGDTSIENIALLFQTGYLTIKKKELENNRPQYTIDFPNMEVRTAFLTNVIENYSNRQSNEINSVVSKLLEQVRNKDDKGLEESLRKVFANIPNNLHISLEAYYHSMFMMLMIAVEYEVEGEVNTNKGRIDVVLKKGKEVIVVEIKHGKGRKVEQLLKEGMEQIKERKYYEKYASSEVRLLAIAFGGNKEIGCKFE